MHTYTHTYTHTYIHTYIRTHVHNYIHTCVHTYIRTYMHAYIHTCIHTYMHTYIHTHVHTYLHTYTQTFTHAYRKRARVAQSGSPGLGREERRERCPRRGDRHLFLLTPLPTVWADRHHFPSDRLRTAVAAGNAWSPGLDRSGCHRNVSMRLHSWVRRRCSQVAEVGSTSRSEGGSVNP